MRTLLSQFCESFDAIVRPLLEPLDGASRALLEGSDELPGREIRAELLELRHQTDVLVQKVAEQQAYVLIFGPLKSGKSDRKSTRLNSSHVVISYAVFCLKKKTTSSP